MPLPAPVETWADALNLQSAATRLTTPCGDGQLVWHRWGEGAPLVLLHGGSGSWTHWMRNIAALAEGGHSVWVPDLPGFGDSSPPPDGHDADVMPTWLEQGLSTLMGQAPVDLIGFSFGGMVASLWAAAHPARVRRLLLLGAPGLGIRRAQPLDLRMWSHLPEGAPREAVMRHNLLELMLQHPASVTELVLHMQAHNLKREHRRMKRRMLSQTDVLRHTLPHLSCPLWGLWGENDALFIDRHTEVAQALGLAPHFQGLHWVPDAGHWVQFEAYSVVNAWLLDWLATPA
jgi:2-hydroxy-6-oxonona-2,4-dienedioate hydrolase